MKLAVCQRHVQPPTDGSQCAYLKIESFRGSTPSELRRIAGQLHADDCRAFVLDLRGTQPGEMRYIEQPGKNLRLARDAEGKSLLAPNVQQKGILPDREVAAGQIAEAVKLLQGKLRATTTAMR
ncbi:MAG TPA: hypothetical protein QF564_13430 [Pirellulaceae bacterium]|nr:hypothetical protein [Pirellulaceae bacterium]